MLSTKYNQKSPLRSSTSWAAFVFIYMTQIQVSRGFKGVWIPREVWLDNDLLWIEKLVLMEIDSLDTEDGCTASNEYLSKMFGVSETRISKIISKLKKSGLIYQENSDGRRRFLRSRLKLDYKSALNSSSRQDSTPVQGTIYSVLEQSKEQRIDNNTEATSCKSDDKEISKEIPEIIDAFKTINPLTKKLFSNKTQRSAAYRLLEAFGKDKVLQIIASLKVSNQKQYAPVITTPYELEVKMGKLAAFWRKQKEQTSKVINL